MRPVHHPLPHGRPYRPRRREPHHGRHSDPTVETVVQVAPAVRAAWGEGVGLSRDEATPGRVGRGLHAVGFDKVF
ncbi:MAG: [Fe-Fe] hydrogenase large subunit C-terminal domain-containing protein [Collinsella sp.]